MTLEKDKTVLLATGFVDGRGGSKMCSWFYDEMIARGFEVIVATTSMYKYKLDELNLKADVEIEIHPTTSRKETYEKCVEGLKDVDFDALVSIGWRTYWPYVALARDIPYVIVDGGIPDRFEEYPSEFIKEVYANSKLFLVTTRFPYEAPANDIIPSLKVVTQPYPYARVESMRELRSYTKAQARDAISAQFPEIAQFQPDLMVYLNMSDACIDPFNYSPNNRGFIDPYGQELPDHMDLHEIEPCIMFMYNLIAGLETNYPGKVLLYLMQEKTKRMAQSVVDMCKSVKTVAPEYLDLDLDPIVKKASDVNICRATNCDNQADLSLIGEPCITTTVPKNYMGEDVAAKQAEEMGVCYQIDYDDPEYIQKMLAVVKDQEGLKRMQQRTIEVFEDFWKNNNFWTELFNAL